MPLGVRGNVIVPNGGVWNRDITEGTNRHDSYQYQTPSKRRGGGVLAGSIYASHRQIVAAVAHSEWTTEHTSACEHRAANAHLSISPSGHTKRVNVQNLCIIMAEILCTSIQHCRSCSISPSPIPLPHAPVTPGMLRFSVTRTET